MECPRREGKKKCIWWVTGCMNPDVSTEVKQACAETCGNLERKKEVSSYGKGNYNQG